MKKMLALALVFLMVMGLLSTTAFAVDSPTDVVDTDGDVTFVDTDITLTDEEASRVSGKDVKVIWTKEVESDSDDPATVTFDVPGSEGKDVHVYQYIDGKWVEITSGAGPSITATIDPRYPVAIGVSEKTSAGPGTGSGSGSEGSGSSSGDKSPATGMDTTPVAVCCIAVLLAAAVCSVYCKKTAH